MTINNTTKKKARILIVDDHAIVRKGIRFLTQREKDLHVCGECEDGAKVLASIKSLKPDIVILDIFLKDMNGIDVLQEIVKQHPKVPVLVLSMHEETLYAERVLRAGAMGYVSKEDFLEKVILAIRKILNGEVYAREDMATNLLGKLLRKPPGGDGR